MNGHISREPYFIWNFWPNIFALRLACMRGICDGDSACPFVYLSVRPSRPFVKRGFHPTQRTQRNERN